MRFIVLLLALYACSIVACNKTNKNPTPEVPFTINGSVYFQSEGIISSLDGYQISLVFEDVSAEKRITTRIDKNGDFTIAPEEVFSPFARLYFEEDLLEERIFISSTPIILEENGINLNLPISINTDTVSYKAKAPKYVFKTNSKSFDTAILTRQYIQLFEQIIEELGPAAYNYGDPKKQAKLVEEEFPAARNRLMAFFRKLVESNTNDLVLLNLFEANVTIDDSNPLSTEYLDESQKDALLGYLNNMSLAAKSTTTFKKVFSRLNTQDIVIDFKDFELTDFNGQTVLLSDLIQKQEYTAFYFWWSGCGPCRIFNRGVNDNQLKTLEEKGIQLISINFDRTKVLWEKATAKDQINWQNFYTGEKSQLYYAYNVRYFPTKLVFNRNAELIEVEWDSLDELETQLSALK